MRIRLFFFLSLVLLIFAGCAKKKAEKQAEEDDRLIQKYLQDNNLTAIKTESGLYYIIDVQGTGLGCNENSDVRVAYTGYFLNNEIFDQSDSQGIAFNLQGVIRGWTEGIPYFREGGSGKLLIPSALAYGISGSGSVPANTVILFDVELLEVL